MIRIVSVPSKLSFSSFVLRILIFSLLNDDLIQLYDTSAFNPKNSIILSSASVLSVSVLKHAATITFLSYDNLICLSGSRQLLTILFDLQADKDKRISKKEVQNNFFIIVKLGLKKISNVTKLNFIIKMQVVKF